MCSGWRNWVRTSEEAPDKGDSGMAIKIILGTLRQSKLIRDSLFAIHRAATPSFGTKSHPRTLGLLDLAIASHATPNTLGNTPIPLAP